MANRKKAPVPDREKSLTEYYDLHAVIDHLLNNIEKEIQSLLIYKS